jgi:hypothetical protein
MEKRFKIGDKVVSLTNPATEGSQPRVKGKTYNVKAVQYCSGCGAQVINLGYHLPIPNSTIRYSDYSDCVCGKEVLNEGLFWTLSKFFARADDLESAIEEAVENEDYETAATLRDLNKEFAIELEQQLKELEGEIK